jgi:protein-S-isoprenylcysteine O-methyltransferase Ste14
VQALRIGLAVLVALVWLVGYALSFSKGTQPPSEVTGLMVLILSWAFAGTIKDSITKRKDDEK